MSGSATTTGAETGKDVRTLASALESLDDGGVETVTLPQSGMEVELMRAVSPAQNAASKPARAKPARAKPARAKPARAKPARAKPARAKPARARSGDGNSFAELMRKAVARLGGDTDHVREGSDGVVTYHDPVAA